MTQGSDYRVDLSIYNGPLDLLLYLIREREVDIHDIPIAEITEQYLSHLEIVQRIDIDRAGDFLLMAATLMLIKSRMLLPRPPADDEEGEEFDPRTDLVQQLLEYKRYKDLSRVLSASEQERLLRFEGGLEPPEPEAPDAGKLLEEIGVEELFLAFERLMRETLSDVQHDVPEDKLPLRELSRRLTDALQAHRGEMRFLELFDERRDRYYIVSVFLCLLEMMRSRRVRLDPGDDVADLRLQLVESAEPPPSRFGNALS